MKRKNYIKIWLLSAVIAGLGAFTSCDNSEYDVLDTHAFIKEALSGTSSKVNVSVDGESKTTLNIHLSDLSTTDNHYKLVVDPSVLDEFNRQNGTSYITLPKGQYILPEDILIKAGEYNAEETEITLEAFSDEMMKSGESYALPLRLVAKDGALPAMDNTGSFVILAESTIRFSAPMFVGGAKLFSQSYIDNPETYAQYTIEVRFQVSALPILQIIVTVQSSQQTMEEVIKSVTFYCVLKTRMLKILIILCILWFRFSCMMVCMLTQVIILKLTNGSIWL